MSNSSSSASSGGISAVGLLGILFVALKLIGVTEVATWSWLWVLAPFWLGLAILLGVMLIAGLVALVVAVFCK